MKNVDMPRRSRSPFVGRKGELARFQDLWRAAADGHGAVAVICGDHGVGKTRLAREIAARAEKTGATILWGQGHDDEGSPAYWPWAEIIARYCAEGGLKHARKLMGRGAPDIAAFVPALERLGAPAVGDPPAAETQYRLFGAMRAFLQKAAEEAPLLIVLDDLHYCDPDTLRLFEAVSGDLERSRLLLIGTYVERRALQHAVLSGVVASLARLPWYCGVPVGNLTTADVRLLLETSGGGDAASLAESVQRKTEGNALLVMETVHHLASRGVEDWEEGASRGVAMLISRRLARLSPEALQAVQAAAVLGRDVDVGLVAGTIGVTAAEARDRLSAAVQDGLLVETGPDRYRFGHELVQRAVSAELAPARHCAIHLAACETLERQRAAGRDVDAGRLAWHFANAGSEHGLKASRYAREAGEKAFDAAAYDTALRRFEESAACPELPPAERAGLALQRAWALFALTRFLEVAPCLAEAFDLYLAAGDVAHAVEAAEFAAYPQAAQRLPREPMRKLRERALALVPPDSPHAARLLCVLGETLSYAHPEEAERCIDRALDLACGFGDRRLGACAFYARAWLLYRNLAPRGLLESGAEALRLAREIGDRRLELLFGGRLAFWKLLYGDPAGAEHLFHELRSLGDPSPTLWTRELQTAGLSLTVWTGRWSEWGRLMAEGWWAWEPAPVAGVTNQPGQPVTFRTAAQILADLEQRPQFYINPDRIAARALEAADVARSLGDRTQLAEIEAAARRALALEISPLGRLSALIALGFVGVLRGDRSLIAEASGPALASAPGDFVLEKPGTVVDSVRGLFFGLLDRTEEARACFERALAFCRRCRLVWELQCTCTYYASFLLRHGERRRAAELVDEGKSVGAGLEVKELERELDAVASRVEGRLPDGLSQREVEVVSLAARGFATKQIAAELDISYFTVGNHLSRIYAKTGCRSRVELAAYAMRHQLAATAAGRQPG